MKGKRPRRACGFSLLEVVLALAILVGALAVLGELISLGTRNAQLARDLTVAQMLCESKLAEITCGISAPDPVQGARFDYAPEWRYSVEYLRAAQQGLVALRVTVTQDLPAEKRPAEFSLVRWMRDPGVVLSEQADAEAAAEAAEESE